MEKNFDARDPALLAEAAALLGVKEQPASQGKEAAPRKDRKMKLDTISRAHGAPVEELVPSRYALQIGEIEVLVISDGVLPLPTSTMSSTVEKTQAAAAISLRARPSAISDRMKALRARFANSSVVSSTLTWPSRRS